MQLTASLAASSGDSKTCGSLTGIACNLWFHDFGVQSDLLVETCVASALAMVHAHISQRMSAPPYLRASLALSRRIRRSRLSLPFGRTGGVAWASYGALEPLLPQNHRILQGV